MKYHNFRIDSFFPPDSSTEYYTMIENEKKKDHVEIQHYAEESAPPPELVKEIIFVTAASLTILRHLHYFYQEIKGKNGKVYITTEDGRFDFEAHNVDEIILKIGEPKISRYSTSLTFSDIPNDILKRMGRTLSFRPVYFEERQLSSNCHTLFCDYNESTNCIETSIQIEDDEVTRLFDQGTPLYAYSEPQKRYEGAQNEMTSLTNLRISVKPRDGSGELNEQRI